MSKLLLPLLTLTALTGCAPRSVSPSAPPSAAIAKSPALLPPSKEADMALRNAVDADDAATVEKSLNAGAAPNELISGRSLVDTAVDHGDVEMVRSLLARLPSLPPVRAQTLLREASQNKKNRNLCEMAARGSVQQVQAALAAGGDINETRFLEMPLIGALSNHSLSVVRFLLAHGANVNKQDWRGQTPLMRAVIWSDKVVALLLSHGAKVNIRDHQGMTPLTWAALDGDSVSVKLLLEHGAKPNVQNRDGQTALMLASYRYQAPPDGDSDMPVFTPMQSRMRRDKVRLLRRYGANPRLKDKDGKKASDYWHRDFYDGPAS